MSDSVKKYDLIKKFKKHLFTYGIIYEKVVSYCSNKRISLSYTEDGMIRNE